MDKCIYTECIALHSDGEANEPNCIKMELGAFGVLFQAVHSIFHAWIGG